MRNYFEFGPVVFEEMVIRYFYFKPFCSVECNHWAILLEGIMKNISVTFLI